MMVRCSANTTQGYQKDAAETGFKIFVIIASDKAQAQWYKTFYSRIFEVDETNTSLLRRFVNYGCKSFTTLEPGVGVT